MITLFQSSLIWFDLRYAVFQIVLYQAWDLNSPICQIQHLNLLISPEKNTIQSQAVNENVTMKLKFLIKSMDLLCKQFSALTRLYLFIRFCRRGV